MPYANQTDVLTVEPLVEWIDQEFLRADPFAFRAGGKYRELVTSICANLGVDPNGVFCIGSGAIGLSLNPTKILDGHLKTFDEGSDLDIAIVSEVHFETAWRDLRRAAAESTLESTRALLSEYLGWQKKRFFDGAILTNKLLPALSYGTAWTTASVRVNERAAILLDREVKLEFWVYRDYWSLRNYVLNSIQSCRKELA